MSAVNSLRRWLYTIGLWLGIALFARQLWTLYQTLPVSHFSSMALHPLLLAFTLYLLGYLIQIVAWWLLMRNLGCALPLRPVIEGYLLSFLARYIPGSVWGYLSRNEWLFQKFQVPYAISSLASLIETLSFLISALGFLLLWAVPAHLRIVMSIAVVAALCLNWRLTPWVYARFIKTDLAFSPTQSPKKSTQTAQLLAGNILYGVFWLVHGAALIAVGWATSPLYPVDLATASFAASLAWSVGFLTLIAPAGLGVRETTLVSLLGNSLAMPAGYAALIAVISRAILIGAEVSLILISFSLNRLSSLGYRPIPPSKDRA